MLKNKLCSCNQLETSNLYWILILAIATRESVWGLKFKQKINTFRIKLFLKKKKQKNIFGFKNDLKHIIINSYYKGIVIQSNFSGFGSLT